MPVTLNVPYATYREQLRQLDLSGCFCISCPGLSPDGRRLPLELTNTLVSKTVFFLEVDPHGVLGVVALVIHIILGRCPVCGSRPRLLPADLLPRKLYALDVINELTHNYKRGDRSLRSVAWDLSGDRTPAFTTLHAWTEGLGAYALGHPAGEVSDALPADTVLTEAASRSPEITDVRRHPPEIPPERYRSEARRDRLSAGAVFLCAATIVANSGGLSELNRLIVLWRASFGLGFRTGLRNTSAEHSHPGDAANSPSKGNVQCLIRGKPPPFDSNRSHRSSMNGSRGPKGGSS